ncbi:zeta toxin family protein [Streptomyces sp. NPDC059525]|uniref:zeta toxin family protein n=1 Tax=Streptomyces sp. NPDC059525 TaxID=3346857 RepID=UPI003677B9DC
MTDDAWPGPAATGRVTPAPPRRDVPTVLLISGPMGAGKTAARLAIAAARGMQQVCHLEADDVYDYHPHFGDLVDEQGVGEAFKLCFKDVNAVRP